MRVRLTVVGLVAAVTCFALAAAVAEASFPGKNGLIAFTREAPRGHSKTIWLMDPRNGRTRQLTHVSRPCAGKGSIWHDDEPSFSASGGLLVYVHWDSCDPRIPNGVYAIRSDGSERRLIAPDGYEGTAPRYPALSPSDRFLAFSDSTLSEPAGEYSLDRVLVSAFPTPGLSWETARAYEWVVHPAWSAHGRLALAVGCQSYQGSGCDSRGHIATVAANGEELRLVTRSMLDDSPDWSPTADRIVFRRKAWDRWWDRGDVWVARARTRHKRRPRRLTESRDAWSPVWSPDRRYIAYTRAPEIHARTGAVGTGSLWIMRAADAGGRRLVATGVLADRISWQPLPLR